MKNHPNSFNIVQHNNYIDDIKKKLKEIGAWKNKKYYHKNDLYSNDQINI